MRKKTDDHDEIGQEQKVMKMAKKPGKIRMKAKRLRLKPVPIVPSGVHIGSDGSVMVRGGDLELCERVASRLAKRMHQRVMTDRMFQ